jgi:hypothetical protein
MGTQRHWKQHWDPDAPLVFIRRMVLGIKGSEVVHPGDKVTPEIRAALGPPHKATARLLRWWNAKFLAIDGWKAPDEIQRARRARGLPRLEIQDVGKGWYLVYGADAGKYTQVRGRKKADELLAKLTEAAELKAKQDAETAAAGAGA